MKLKANLVLRQIATNWVVLPLAERTLDFSGILTLNDSGKMLWQLLENGCEAADMVAALMAEYEVTEEVAKADVEKFLQKLQAAGCIED